MKKAFTLVEVIISIFIFSLIMIFLYQSISSLKKNNINLKQTTQKSKILSKIITLLKTDIIYAKKINLKHLNNDILSLKTLNSLHNISKPNVTWKILEQNNELVRVEEINGIKLLDDTTIQCKSFKIYFSRKEHKVLLYIKTLDNKTIITETISSL